MKRELQRHEVVGVQGITEQCIVCGMDNPSSFHTQFLDLDDGRVAAVLHPTPNLQSYPDRMHGGVIGSVMDELLSRAVQAKRPGELSVTLELNLKYRAPLPLEGQVLAVAWVVKDRSRTYDAAGEVLLSDGTVAVQATGRFMKVELDDVSDQDTSRYFYPDERPHPDWLMV